MQAFVDWMEDHRLVERMLRANLHQRQYMQQVGWGWVWGFHVLGSCLGLGLCIQMSFVMSNLFLVNTWQIAAQSHATKPKTSPQPQPHQKHIKPPGQHHPARPHHAGGPHQRPPGPAVGGDGAGGDVWGGESRGITI